MFETTKLPPTLPPPRATLFELAGRGRRRLPDPLRGPLSRVLALDELERGYAKIAGETDSARFLERALLFLDVRTQIEPGPESAIPRAGATIVVANHPFGGLEGLALARILLARRPDVRILANSILSRVPELAALVFAVDPAGGERAARASFAGLRRAARWLEMGGCLLVFPAGTVSHLDLGARAVRDPRWNASVARLARRSAAGVHPVWVDGRNGNFFQLAGLLHPSLRTALLPCELANKRGSSVRLCFGTRVAPSELAGFEDDESAAEYLRLCTDVLGLRQRALRAQSTKQASAGAHTALAPRVSTRQLAGEIAALRAQGKLVAQQGRLCVFRFDAQGSRALLHELARERERAFRSAGQGSGLARDLDRFDEHYTELVLWDEAAERVAGGVRLVAADRAARERGVRGLYTSTLFDYGPELLGAIGPCFEVGRSFVAEEHQRSYAALLLLWKGIAAHVAREPERTKLIGSVSISARYSPLARQMMAASLERHHEQAELARHVRARTPLRRARIAGWDPAELERALASTVELSRLIADLEPDRKGLPVLLRAYLELGARTLALGLDPHFENTLDVLVLIDLQHSPRRILERCFGRETAAELFVRGGRVAPHVRASA